MLRSRFCRKAMRCSKSEGDAREYFISRQGRERWPSSPRLPPPSFLLLYEEARRRGGGLGEAHTLTGAQTLRGALPTSRATTAKRGGEGSDQPSRPIPQLRCAERGGKSGDRGIPRAYPAEGPYRVLQTTKRAGLERAIEGSSLSFSVETGSPMTDGRTVCCVSTCGEFSVGKQATPEDKQ